MLTNLETLSSSIATAWLVSSIYCVHDANTISAAPFQCTWTWESGYKQCKRERKTLATPLYNNRQMTKEKKKNKELPSHSYFCISLKSVFGSSISSHFIHFPFGMDEMVLTISNGWNGCLGLKHLEQMKWMEWK